MVSVFYAWRLKLHVKLQEAVQIPEFKSMVDNLLSSVSRVVVKYLLLL